MTRSEWACQYREARKVMAFCRTFESRLDGKLPRIVDSVSIDALRAVCRYGDTLRFRPYRWPHLGKRYRSRVSGRVVGA